MKTTLLLTHEYYPFTGGVARYCYNLFKFYDLDKYFVISDHPEVFTKYNIYHKKLLSRFIWPTWLYSFLAIKMFINKNKIEQIFTPNILPLGTMCYFLGLPYIISLHGLDINLALKNKPGLTKKILNNAKYIIVNSKYTAGQLDKINIAKSKIKLIYPPVAHSDDYDHAKLADLKQLYKVTKDDRVLLTVGRLTHRKGHDLVIRAVNDLKNKFRLKYFIVGRGSLKKYLEEKIDKYNLADQIFILDKVSDDELIYYYKMTDLFVLPNRQSDTDVEGFGMVFLEAAGYELPIIAGRGGGVTEILTEDQEALFVISDNLDQLIAKISQILSDKIFSAKLAKAAKRRFYEFANPQEASDQLKEIL